MKYGLLALGIALAIALYSGWFARAYDDLTYAALTDDGRLAVDVRCQHHAGEAAVECRDMLKRLYLAGTLDPDKTLRSYCDEIKHARWGGSYPPPPRLCVERYGGWQGS